MARQIQLHGAPVSPVNCIDENGKFIDYYDGRRRPVPQHDCKVYSFRPHLHLIDHVFQGMRRVQTIPLDSYRLPNILSLTTLTPGPEETASSWKVRNSAGKAAQSVGSFCIGNSADYASMVLDENWRVYRPAWHPTIHAAFGLEDPPTPREVVNYLVAKKGPFCTGIMSRTSVCGLSMLTYYCIGAHAPSLARIFSLTEEELIGAIALTIKQLCGHLAFKLWASGSDLTPLCHTTPLTHYFNTIMTQRVTGMNDNTKRLLPSQIAALRNKDSYFQLIAIEGLRLNPIQRMRTLHDIAWKTNAAKRHMEETWWWGSYASKNWRKNKWMFRHLQTGVGLDPTIRLEYFPFRGEAPPDKKLHMPFDFMKELANLYGKEGINEAEFARVYAKWADYETARTGSPPRPRSSYRFASCPTDGVASRRHTDDLLEGTEGLEFPDSE